MQRLLAHLALLVVAVIYGCNYLVAKGLMPDLVGPSGFIVLRVSAEVDSFGWCVQRCAPAAPGRPSNTAISCGCRLWCNG